MLRLTVLALGAVLWVGCSQPAAPPASAMRLESPDLQDVMARDCTADGPNRPPALSWTGVPPGTRELALACVDTDAPGGDFTHWLVFGLPPTAAGPSGGLEGQNSFGTTGYSGPDPPPGGVHHYHFWLYALDRPSGLTRGATPAQFQQALEGHVVARAERVATYAR